MNFAIAAVLSTSGLALAAEPVLLIDNKVEFPEGGVVPRYALPAERAWMDANPNAGMEFLPRGPFTQPTVLPIAPGEYAPADGILFAWEGGATLNALQAQMIRHVTTTGQARAYVAFDTPSEQTSQMPVISAAGADMSRVIPVIGATDTIWIRDYGPRYTYEGNVRVISDHTYNVTSRANDNNFPVIFAAQMKHARYVLPLLHGGGNYHLNSTGEGFATQLIGNENPTRTLPQIIQLWRDHWGPNTQILPAFPQAIDATQHIDMWMQIVGDRKVIISDWPANPGSTQDVICDNQAAAMTNAGWTVYRVPARSLVVGGFATHYTYTNMVMCNDVALIPTYTNTSMTQYNAQVLATYQQALPGKTVVQLDCEFIVQLSGVMHCIVMHVPTHLGAQVDGGLAPTALLRAPNGGQSVSPGQTLVVNYITDDDNAVSNVDVLLSRDAGATWNPIATAIPNTGTLNWIVPDIYTTRARIRVVARDAQGRTGSDDSNANFAILGTRCPADFDDGSGNGNPDGGVGIEDLLYYLAIFEAGTSAADVDNGTGAGVTDGGVGIEDLLYYLARFENGC